jgi:quercetin 2,3-dioxygenase
MKQLGSIVSAPAGHWVGDGFPVRTLFSYDPLGPRVSPFLLLDYAGPHDFAATDQRRGVGEHPHRGFETVTIVYEGEVDHRDSAGNGGSIGPGDVQWMTAGSGVMHEEFHAPSFSRRGGKLEMVQLWVNLPAAQKMSAPRYQAIKSESIPVVQLAQAAGSLRVIAGNHAGVRGPSLTFTELNVFDISLQEGAQLELPLPDGHNAVIALLQGRVLLASGEEMNSADLALFGAEGAGLSLVAKSEAKLLAMSGVPIREPIIGYGPFVMNTRDEIVKAFADLESGQFGRLG